MGRPEHPLFVDFDSATPLYAQLVDQVTRLIDSGAWEVALRLPSVRELAIRLRINPMTVQKAYQHLKLRGYLQSRRGLGVFVRKAQARVSGAEFRRQLRDVLNRGRQLGVDLRAAVDDALKGPIT